VSFLVSVAVKLTGPVEPKGTEFGLTLLSTRVVATLAGADTTIVPSTVRVLGLFWQVPALGVAVTVKLYVFAVIAEGVLIVSVEVWSVPVLVSELEENEKKPPTGGDGHMGEPVGATLRSTVQEVPLPLKVSVSV
jgi:hypothetical protein